MDQGKNHADLTVGSLSDCFSDESDLDLDLRPAGRFWDLNESLSSNDSDNDLFSHFDLKHSYGKATPTKSAKARKKVKKKKQKTKARSQIPGLAEVKVKLGVPPTIETSSPLIAGGLKEDDSILAFHPFISRKRKKMAEKLIEREPNAISKVLFKCSKYELSTIIYALKHHSDLSFPGTENVLKVAPVTPNLPEDFLVPPSENKEHDDDF